MAPCGSSKLPKKRASTDNPMFFFMVPSARNVPFPKIEQVKDKAVDSFFGSVYLFEPASLSEEYSEFHLTSTVFDEHLI